MIPISIERWGMRRLDMLVETLGRGPTGPPHLLAGLRGEREAFFHLRGLGYTVVARRWTTPKVRGDVDLVAWHADVLCFVEVKTRGSRGSIAAEVAVDRDKRMQLRRHAHAYLKAFDERQRDSITVRFDVVSVYLPPSGPEFEVLESAFGWQERRANAW